MEIRYLVRQSLPCVLLFALVIQRYAVGQGNSTTQSQESWVVSVSHIGKWTFLAATAGLTTMAAIKMGRADDRFDELQTFCQTAIGICSTEADGAFIDPTAERLFQETRSLDGQAQRFLIGGQFTLMVSGALFLVDLLSDHGGPENIPFTPLKLFQQGNLVGLRIEY